MTGYRLGNSIPVITVVLLGGMVAPALLKIGGLLLMLGGLGELGGPPDSGLADTGLLIVGFGAIGSLLLYLPTVVLFCVWAHRANGNARALGAGDMRFTPGWTVGWFFVPFAHLWMPFKAIGEAWRASDPVFDTRGDPTSWMDARLGLLVPMWWACWVFSFLVGNAGSRLMLAGHDAVGAWVSVPGAVLKAMAASLAIAVVLGLHRRQRRKATLLRGEAA